MKKTKEVLCAFIFIMATICGNAQTNVSGGIYSNTTWSLSGSPYIIADTVVLFPGVILAIQPGVTVKFNASAQIEVRQAAIVALGTSADSITFTSNSSLTASSWSSVYLTGGTMTSKFNYCVFKYAADAIYDNRGGAGDTVIIKNSSFMYNYGGYYGQGTSYGIVDSCNFTNNSSGCSTLQSFTAFNYCNLSYNSSTGISGCKGCILNNCAINNNQIGLNGLRGSTVNNCKVCNNVTGININNDVVNIKNTTVDSNSTVGISISGSSGDSVFNCQIKYNGVGLRSVGSGLPYPTSITKNIIENNTTGFELQATTYNISCNKICNNTTYDLQYTGTNNITAAHNFWCTTDSASTEVVIYDGYDNTSYGLVHFMPIDSCYLTTGISIYKTQSFSFKTFPNPATDYLTIELPAEISKAEIKIFNLLGELTYSSAATTQKTNIDISSLASGIYIIQATTGGNISKQKFIKQ